MTDRYQDAMTIAVRGAMSAALCARENVIKLDTLAGHLTLEGLGTLGIALSDLALCWRVHDLPVPAEVVGLVRTALAGPEPEGLRARAERQACQAVLAAIEGRPPRAELRPPADLDWDELATWAEEAGSLAAPGLDGGVLVGHEEALLRGVGMAILSGRWLRAATLMRWLSLRPPAPEWASDHDSALKKLLVTIHRKTDDEREWAQRMSATVQVSAALALSRRAWGDPVTQRVPRRPSPRPDAEPRRLLGTRALAWVERNRHHFTFPGVDFPGAQLRVKALGDLALVARVALHAGDAGVRERARALLDFAWRQLGEGEHMRTLIERTPALSVYATIQSILHAEGRRSPALDRILVEHAEAVPDGVALLVCTSLEDMGLTPPSGLAAKRQAALDQALRPPWLVNRYGAYLFTHTVFALTDMGRRPSPVDLGSAVRWLPVWMTAANIVSHNDLLAEMIMAWHMLQPDECVPDHFWRALLAAQHDDGRVAFSSDRIDPASRTSVGDYHSTLVSLAAALLCGH